MTRETIVILGIPVDNLDMDETVERIFGLIEASRKDSRARLVATVNVDFVVNTLTWRLSRFRHPELIDILRRADLVTPDGMPIIWTSRMLGTPLKERVTGADLVPGLAQAAARRGKSIYFLGGRGDVTRSHLRWSGGAAASVPSPTPCNGLMYWVTNDGKACCQDPQSGKLKYNQALPVSGRFAVYASVVSAGNRIYAVTRKEGTFVLAAQPEFEVIAHNQLKADNSDFNGSPAVSNGRLFLRSNRLLYCISD